MSESRIDKLKERLTHFIKEGTSNDSLKVPNRIICGFKLEHVSVAIQDLLRDKYHNELEVIGFEKEGESDYLFRYKIIV
jgi:hypothetical protein